MGRLTVRTTDTKSRVFVHSTLPQFIKLINDYLATDSGGRTNSLRAVIVFWPNTSHRSRIGVEVNRYVGYEV